MTRAQLFFLFSKFSLRPQSFTHHFPAKTSDYDIALRASSLSGINDVLNHGLACSLVQNLREFGFHTGALAGGKDYSY